MQVGCDGFDSHPLHNAASEVFSVACLASNQEERVLESPPRAGAKRRARGTLRSNAFGPSSTRVTVDRLIVFDLFVADPNGQGPVCKTGTRGFNSPPHAEAKPRARRFASARDGARAPLPPSHGTLSACVRNCGVLCLLLLTRNSRPRGPTEGRRSSKPRGGGSNPSGGAKIARVAQPEECRKIRDRDRMYARCISLLVGSASRPRFVVVAQVRFLPGMP